MSSKFSGLGVTSKLMINNNNNNKPGRESGISVEISTSSDLIEPPDEEFVCFVAVGEH